MQPGARPPLGCPYYKDCLTETRKMSLQSALRLESYMLRILFVVGLLGMAGCTSVVLGGSSEPAERSAGATAADMAISTRVRSRLAADDFVSIFNIGVQTYNGTVTLSGRVGTIAARVRAEQLARETDGVSAVNNQIVLEDRSR